MYAIRTNLVWKLTTVLLDVMTIADEVDSQLKQAILGFMEEPAPAQSASPTARPGLHVVASR